MNPCLYGASDGEMEVEAGWNVVELELTFPLSLSPGQPIIPDALLLRDSLYLLQGIDGRFVNFLIPVQDPNPYRRPPVDPEGEEEPFRLVFEDDPKVRRCLLQMHGSVLTLSSSVLPSSEPSPSRRAP